MKVLSLSIKQNYFDDIVAGIKKDEFREIRPNNASRYVYYKADGKEYKDGADIPEDAKEIEVLPIKYDALKLITGEYKGQRPFIIIGIKDSEVQFLTDEDDNDIVYEYEGEEYLTSQIRYGLGTIIEKFNV